MKENYIRTKLSIMLTVAEDFVTKFSKWYNIEVHEDFVAFKDDKKHNISSHSKWFRKKIYLNHSKESTAILNKWKICMVDYWMNVWTEINWIRPSIVFKNSNYKYWEDIFVIPMTSYKEEQEKVKSKDEFDIESIVLSYIQECLPGTANNPIIHNVKNSKDEVIPVHCLGDGNKEYMMQDYPGYKFTYPSCGIDAIGYATVDLCKKNVYIIGMDFYDGSGYFKRGVYGTQEAAIKRSAREGKMMRDFFRNVPTFEMSNIFSLCK